MKNLIKKIGQNKFQFFFFVGLAAVILVSLVISKTIDTNTQGPNENPGIDNPTENPNPDDSGNVDVKPEEVFKLPFAESMQYQVVRKYYDKSASLKEQEQALIKYNNSYRTSNGTSFANMDNKVFDVTSVLSGKVLEIKDSPLYGKYVVLEHNETLKTYYYGLSEVTVTVGATVNQGDKLGVSGTTEIDSECGVHVFLKVTKNNNHINPETLIGKKISEI